MSSLPEYNIIIILLTFSVKWTYFGSWKWILMSYFITDLLHESDKLKHDYGIKLLLMEQDQF